MPDGRLLMRSGDSFLIMEPGELDRLRSWMVLSLTIDFVALIALVAAVTLSERGAISESDLFTIVWIVAGVFMLTALSVGPAMLFTLRRKMQPAEDRDRLREIWNRAV